MSRVFGVQNAHNGPITGLTVNIDEVVSRNAPKALLIVHHGPEQNSSSGETYLPKVVQRRYSQAHKVP